METYRARSLVLMAGSGIRRLLRTREDTGRVTMFGPAQFGGAALWPACWLDSAGPARFGG